ncbi:MAG: iron hydrogenase small subunit [Vampirovibrionales bacterium]|nr:iron hydrogenase small subunit [Vampirovibrionales bacterium]
MAPTATAPQTLTAQIDGLDVAIQAGETILDAAKRAHVRIPTLCKHPDVHATAACGICVVKVGNSNKMLRACCTPIEAGMSIVTQDPEIVEIRKSVVELILSNHPNECFTCGRNTNCELQSLAATFGVRETPFGVKAPDHSRDDDSTRSIVLEPNKCISCGRCVDICQNVQNVWALSFLNRGINIQMAPAGDILLADSPCVRCGQCSAHCPTGAIHEYDQTDEVWNMLQNKDLHVVAQIAPAVRVALGECFGLEPGVNLTKQIYAALRRLGFHTVFDTNFSADLTIMEEAAEFVERFANGKGVLPLITTCCPSWVDFMEKYHSDMIAHFSSCKSPQMMLGALAKTYFAEKRQLDPANMRVVSVMPCTAKKYEVNRSEEMRSSGFQDVDVSITTRELARMIKQAGIDLLNLDPEESDHLMGNYSGAGTIFANTGGVMEAALRTAYFNVTGQNLSNPDILATRGLEGVKEGAVDVNGTEVRVAVAHGLGNVEAVINRVREAKEKGEPLPWHFIEVMACPGGCIGGGGQPYGVTDGTREKRMKGIYDEDKSLHVRCSHENYYINQVYDDFLGKPLSEKSHHLLHTHYVPRPMYLK